MIKSYIIGSAITTYIVNKHRKFIKKNYFLMENKKIYLKLFTLQK